ncbi:hypothetical protein NEMIN01_1765 [Nematocida minor]|uniref:uncharacterized protein n=1 Tax=Nematocida minor TaxID=1912983 RepID=UPI0022202A14|nr:uncharacterized protein NEMIN01_1765 [Nematocida minor]KAI5191981.1 hypothetical protein NEMIN01_1765 [Nematocida minor]
MNCFSVERFKEEGFEIKEFLEELYEECRRKEGSTCDKIKKELETIKDALAYKETELKEKKVYYSDRSKIEEISNSLSSIELSKYSNEFIRVCKERDAFLKRNRFISYFTAVEKNTLMEIAETEKETRLQEIAEFVDLLTGSNKYANHKRKSTDGSIGSSITHAIKSLNPFSHSNGNSNGGNSKNDSNNGNSVKSESSKNDDKNSLYNGNNNGNTSANSANVLHDGVEGGESAAVSDSMQERLDGYKKDLLSLAMSSYNSCISSGNHELAKKYASVCCVLGNTSYPIDYLVNNDKAMPEFPSMIVTEIDLLKENALHDLAKYLDTLQEHIEEKVEMIKDIFINNQYIAPGQPSSSNIIAEIYEVVRHLFKRLFSPVGSSIASISDPVEYLITVETVLSHGAIIKERVSYILPDVRDKICKYSVLSLSEDELLGREMESMNLIVNGLIKAVSSGKSSLKYKINGEVLTQLRSPLESVFKYMAVCSRISMRCNKLSYSSKVADQIYQTQIHGFTLLMNSIFSTKYAPYLGTSLHLNLYLCIKTFYKKLTSKCGNEKSISKIISQLNKEEGARNRSILNNEMAHLVKKLDKYLDEYKSEETVELMNKSFAHLVDTPILSTVVNETLEIFSSKIKEKAFTRSSIKEVKSMLEYITVFYKSIKVLKTTEVEKKVRKIKMLVEGVLVDSEDVDRILDVSRATREEEQMLRRLRERVKNK